MGFIISAKLKDLRGILPVDFDGSGFRLYYRIFDLPEGKDISGVRHGTMVSRLCIWCLVSRQEFGSMEGAARRDMEGTLRAREICRNIIGKISGIQGTNYTQLRREVM